jgi:hypothetical protein
MRRGDFGYCGELCGDRLDAGGIQGAAMQVYRSQELIHSQIKQ